jgi:hypothetical protein
MEQQPVYNLMSAAAAAGVNRSTVLRAIKAGRISAQRDNNNGWEIDPAEFHRVFPPLPLPGVASPQQDQQQIDGQVALLRNLVEQLRNDMEAREEDHRKREQDLRQDRDHWRETFQAAQRRLPSPEQQHATAAPLSAQPSPQSSLSFMVALVTLDWMMAARLRCLKMGPLPGQRFGQKEPTPVFAETVKPAALV